MTIQGLTERLEAAYQVWHDSKGSHVDHWAALVDDAIVLRSVGHESGGLSFAKARRSREGVLDYFAKLNRDWRMEYYCPRTFIDDGGRVAVFGSCKWTYRTTGKSAEVMFAHFWRFRGDKAVELVEIFDSARAVAAATPD